LNVFQILKTLRFDIVDCLGSRFNTAIATYVNVFRKLILFEKLLHVAGIKITSAYDLDVTAFSSVFAILRDNPSTINIGSDSSAAAVFSTIRIYYNWCLIQMKPGYNAETGKYLDSIRFKSKQRGKRLKQMDPDHGPFSTLEMVTLDRYFTKQLNNWDDLTINEMSAVLTYWLSRETSRRSDELSVLDVDDIIQEGNLSYIFLGGHRPTDTGIKPKENTAFQILFIRYWLVI